MGTRMGDAGFQTLTKPHVISAKLKQAEGDMIKALDPLEVINDSLDLDKYMYEQILSDRVAREALHLLIDKGYSAEEVKLALEKLK